MTQQLGDCTGCGIEYKNGTLRPLVDPDAIDYPLQSVTPPVAGNYQLSGTPADPATDCSSLKWDCRTGELWSRPEPCCQRFTAKDIPVIGGAGTRFGGSTNQTFNLCGDCACGPGWLYIFGCVRLCISTTACDGWRVFGQVSIAGRSCQIADGVQVTGATLGDTSRDLTIQIQNLVPCSNSVQAAANLTATNWNTDKAIPVDVTACFDLTVLQVECS